MESIPVGRNVHPASYKPGIMSLKEELFLSQFQFWEEKLVARKAVLSCLKIYKPTEAHGTMSPQFQVQTSPTPTRAG